MGQDECFFDDVDPTEHGLRQHPLGADYNNGDTREEGEVVHEGAEQQVRALDVLPYSPLLLS